ncbi:chemotaxis protein [Shewanella intestini]|uniref:Chemotaxis protein n=1 Tax=Shewanella intestini TaxID=2017544 RepID=A0ABS5I1G5_9GAMM|nr:MULTISPECIES: chemotaxis protein [Shewanella]MBR9727872.1 chemotaxis protein [Shewanella intestini]MRG36135.1 chemotaxis protein [Shewanella sp. XMDDZSB0408]
MQIPSASVSGSQALQSAQQGLAQATTAVAQPDPRPIEQDSVTLSSQAVSQTDTNTALISAIESEQQGEAATRVLEASNETIGSVIDISV